MKSGKRRKHLSQAMVFLLLFGIVSLFSDMTHEGASSIRGAYLSIMGASAGAIGFFSGLGELIGYSRSRTRRDSIGRSRSSAMCWM